MYIIFEDDTVVRYTAELHWDAHSALKRGQITKYTIYRNNEDESFQKQYNLETIERDTILNALKRTNYVQKDAAKLLGITPKTLIGKIDHHKINHPSWRKKR